MGYLPPTREEVSIMQMGPDWLLLVGGARTSGHSTQYHEVQRLHLPTLRWKPPPRVLGEPTGSGIRAGSAAAAATQASAAAAGARFGKQQQQQGIKLVECDGEVAAAGGGSGGKAMAFVSGSGSSSRQDSGVVGGVAGAGILFGGRQLGLLGYAPGFRVDVLLPGVPLEEQQYSRSTSSSQRSSFEDSMKCSVGASGRDDNKLGSSSSSGIDAVGGWAVVDGSCRCGSCCACQHKAGKGVGKLTCGELRLGSGHAREWPGNLRGLVLVDVDDSSEDEGGMVARVGGDGESVGAGGRVLQQRQQQGVPASGAAADGGFKGFVAEQYKCQEQMAVQLQQRGFQVDRKAGLTWQQQGVDGLRRRQNVGRRFSAGFTRLAPPSPEITPATDDEDECESVTQGGRRMQGRSAAALGAQEGRVALTAPEEALWAAAGAEDGGKCEAEPARAAGGAWMVMPPLIVQLLIALLVGLVLMLVVLGTEDDPVSMQQQQQLLGGGAGAAEL